MYPGSEESEEDARALSRRCMEDLFPSGLRRIRAFRIAPSFARWFGGCGCDVALAVQDYDNARWWVLLGTDVD